MVASLIMQTPAAWLACGIAVSLALLLLPCLKSVRGTTLTAPCIWAVISAFCLVILTFFEALSPAQTITRDALRFTAAASTFCPIMAVLGAKRPQDRGWQWIVLSLWAITIWPAVQAALLPVGTQLELYIVWKLFLLGLIAIGLLNYLPTKFALPALLIAAGQYLLFDQYLWKSLPLPNYLAIPLTCFFAAQLIAMLSTKTTNQPTDDTHNDLQQYENLWLTFRNAYGAFWALRILARVNETAQLRHWSHRLTWAGFEPHPHDTNETPTETQLTELDQALTTLLRRFNKLDNQL